MPWQPLPVKIDPQTYGQMKAWFARLVPETFPPELLTPATDPIACLEQIEAKSPANARKGLAEAIGDIVELTDNWPPEKVAQIDGLLAQDGLPTLTDMRSRNLA